MSIVPVNSEPRRVELMRLAYEATGTSTSTAASGAALSTAWGGNITIGARTSVEIWVYVPFLYLSVGSTTAWSEVHLMVAGTSRASAFRGSPNSTSSALSGGRELIYAQVDSLTPGTVAVAVQLKVSSGTGTIAGSATNKGWLIVREL